MRLFRDVTTTIATVVRMALWGGNLRVVPQHSRSRVRRQRQERTLTPAERWTRIRRRRRTRRMGRFAWLVSVGVVVSVLIGPNPPAAAAVTQGGIQTLSTTRVLDTRKTSAVGPGRTVSVSVAADATGSGIPVAAPAALVNVAVIHATRPGSVTVFPAGRPRPGISSLSFDTFQMAYANQVLVRLGSGGRISIYNGSTAPVHLTLDTTGYVQPGADSAAGATAAIGPARVLDTSAGVGAPKGPLRPDVRLDVQVGGRGGVPASGVAGVWMKVTVASPQGRGFVIGWPAGRTRPWAATVTFAAGQTVANHVFLPVSAAGRVSFMNRSAGSLRLIGDIVGYTRAGTAGPEGTLAAVPPGRVLDTGTGTGAPARPVASRKAVVVQVAGRAGVPLMGARAVLLNVAAASAQAPGYLTLYAGSYCTPKTYSTINFSSGRTISNMVLAPLAPDGTVTLFNASNGTVRIAADVSGWIRGPQAPAGALSVSGGATDASRLSISDDGRYVGYGSYIWDAQSRATTLMTRPVESENPPYCDSGLPETPISGSGELSGDGQHILYFHPSRYFIGPPIHVVTRSDGTSQGVTWSQPSNVSIADNGRHLAFAPRPGLPEFDWPVTTLWRWDRTTREHETVVTVPEERSIRASQISGDGRTIIYEVGTYMLDSDPTEVFRWHDEQPERIAQGTIHDVSDDGNTILMTVTDGPTPGLALWSSGTLTQLASESVERPVDVARLSGDGRIAVWQQQESSDPDSPVALYRTEGGAPAVKIIENPAGSRVTAVALSDDGARLAYIEQDDPADRSTGGLAVFLR